MGYIIMIANLPADLSCSYFALWTLHGFSFLKLSLLLPYQIVCVRKEGDFAQWMALNQTAHTQMPTYLAAPC